MPRIGLDMPQLPLGGEKTMILDTPASCAGTTPMTAVLTRGYALGDVDAPLLTEGSASLPDPFRDLPIPGPGRVSLGPVKERT